MAQVNIARTSTFLKARNLDNGNLQLWSNQELRAQLDGLPPHSCLHQGFFTAGDTITLESIELPANIHINGNKQVILRHENDDNVINIQTGVYHYQNEFRPHSDINILEYRDQNNDMLFYTNINPVTVIQDDGFFNEMGVQNNLVGQTTNIYGLVGQNARYMPNNLQITLNDIDNNISYALNAPIAHEYGLLNGRAYLNGESNNITIERSFTRFSIDITDDTGVNLTDTFWNLKLKKLTLNNNRGFCNTL
ncbi:hypothetical protein PRJ_Dakar_00284 [Faustovirus]|nr:hypothetical protein PRJ_Dakar_00284 [Faustovirus]